jgi:hypothetical protein
MRVRDALVDGPNSVGARMRARRWALFGAAFPDASDLRVLDLGGTVEYWKRAPIRPRQVTVVNLFEPGDPTERITPVTADACLFEPRGDFDLVVSNSLLEHVGGHDRRTRLAAVVREAAPRHWVQTPYRYFPVEPHWLCPGMQFLPVAARVAVARVWPLAHTVSANRAEALESVLWTELIGRTEMQALFPDSVVSFERMAGLPKSLLAIRTVTAIRPKAPADPPVGPVENSQ